MRVKLGLRDGKESALDGLRQVTVDESDNVSLLRDANYLDHVSLNTIQRSKTDHNDSVIDSVISLVPVWIRHLPSYYRKKRWALNR